MSAKRFLRVLDGERVEGSPPLWLMRQAGRYLPEYRAIRATAPSFLDFCYNPALTVEATLQPIRRFDFDAAILFSDILVVPHAMGQHVSFETGHGPRLAPLAEPENLSRLQGIDLEHLAPVFETIDRLKVALPPATALIGFCGAPWTVASYMVAGRGTPDQAPARIFAYRHPEAFQSLIDRLVEASIAYLDRQIEAGVEAVQIFDSWAGVLPMADYRRWCQAPMAAIVAGLRARRPGVRIIGFPRVSGHQLIEAATTGVTALSLDTEVDPAWADTVLPPHLPLQGNLDPLVLLAGGAALDAAIDVIQLALQNRPHVFNLGHGILPETPIAHVERLVARLRGAA